MSAEQENKIVVIEKKIHFSASLDYLIINDQINNAQFPVLFAPNRKKQGTDIIPFFNISVLQKKISEERSIVSSGAEEIDQEG